MGKRRALSVAMLKFIRPEREIRPFLEKMEHPVPVGKYFWYDKK